MSPAKTRARKRLPAAERRQQIAELALELIAARGVSLLTAAALAERLGLSDAALFRHFDGMGAIVDAAIDVFEGALMEGFPPRHDDPIERLRLFFLQRTSLVQGAPHILKLAFDERLVDNVGATSARRIRRIVERSQQFVADCIEQAQRQGRIADDIPTSVLVGAVVGVVRSSVAPPPSSGGSRSRPSPEELWQATARLLLRSVTPSGR